MIGIIVATHGEFASGLIDGMTLLCGEQEKIIPFGLRIEDDMDVFSSDIIAKAHELDDGDGVLVLVDFVGGTPANITGKLLMNEPNMEGLSGVNFPMILEAVNSRDDSTLTELKEQCKVVGTMGIVDIKERMSSIMDDDD